MINREITYKRDMGISYMIIPSMAEESFDEKLLLKNPIEGTVPMKKCYLASSGQYWYDISGKQALDAYCRIHSIDKDFFENLILKLCQLVERLEWRLIDVNCLVLDPELVFINAYEEEVFFVIYPYHKGSLFLELQQLLEYLLTRLDHKDVEAVGCAYRLYEMVLTESISIEDLKKAVSQERKKRIEVEPIQRITEESEEREENPQAYTSSYQKWVQVFIEKIKPYYEKAREEVEKYLPKRKEDGMVVYPEDIEDAQEEIRVNPTICLRTEKKGQGELRCASNGLFSDYTLEKGSYIIGKNHKVKIRIDKDTVSQFHARIEYYEDHYYIEDLNSTNGTYVNEQPLSYKTRRQLQNGDSIRFGDVRYEFFQ